MFLGKAGQFVQDQINQQSENQSSGERGGRRQDDDDELPGAHQRGGRRKDNKRDDDSNARPWEGDFSGAADIAKKNDDGDDPSLFHKALSFMQSQDVSGEINEKAALDSHDQVYKQGGAGGVTAGSLGSAAALQALKSFLSGKCN